MALKEGAGFGRCDIRVDREGAPVRMLEINANCGIYFPPDSYGGADVALTLDPDGHAALAQRLVEACLWRHRKRLHAGAPGTLNLTTGATIRCPRSLRPQRSINAARELRMLPILALAWLAAACGKDATTSAVPDFVLTDVNPSSLTAQQPGCRRDSQKVSAWYFGHAT